MEVPGGNAENPEEPLSEVLTPQEVARFLRISERSAYRYIREGVIPSFRVGRSIRVLRAALDRPRSLP